MLQKNRADSTIYEHTLIIEKVWHSVLNNSIKLKFNDNIKLAIERRLTTVSNSRAKRLEERTVEKIDEEIFECKKRIIKLEKAKQSVMLNSKRDF